MKKNRTVLFLWMLLIEVYGSVKVTVDPCDRYDLIACGSKEVEWMLCRPFSQGYKILNARLDVRFPTKHCEEDGGRYNFGLSVEGRNMWVVNNCYGAFLLCLIKDQTVEDNDHTDGRIQITKEHTRYKKSPPPLTAALTSLFKSAQDIATLNKTTVATLKGPAANEVNQTLSSTVNVTDQEFQTSGIPYLQTNDLSSEEEFEMTFALKYWLIFGVVAGGVTMIGLIAFITYLVIYWNEESYVVSERRKARRAKASNNNPGGRYFRTEKHSTSTLISAELEPEDAVYAVIPVRAQDLRMTNEKTKKKWRHKKHDATNACIDRKEHRIVTISRTISLNDNDKTGVSETPYKCPLDSKVLNQSAGANNLYHCLNDARRHISFNTKNNALPDSINPIIGSSLLEAKRRFSEQSPRPVRHTSPAENEYDRLSHAPRKSLPDFTYNHLYVEKNKTQK